MLFFLLFTASGSYAGTTPKKPVKTAKAAVTTCANANVILPSALPITSQALVCGTTNDLSATSVPATCGGASNSYKGGNEALYTLTPTQTASYTISISGQTWTAIFVYAGCPTSGGTCVGSVGSSASSKNISVTLTAGTQYYIWFDTWPTPNSPCAGTFSITAPPPACTGTPVAGTINTPSPACAGNAPAALTVAGTTSGVSGLSYQWEESDDNGVADAWANAVGGSGAATVSYTPPVLTASRYYRFKVTCSGSSETSTTASALVSISTCDYNVTRSTGITYNSIASTGTGLTGFTSLDDATSTSTGIGFNFFYKGTTYTNFSVNTNGFISLGSNTLPSQTYTNSLTSNTNIIAPFWDDLYVTGSVPTSQVGNYIKYKLDGSAPNRVLTVEWIGMEQYQYAGPNINFQAKLYETTNKIEFIYGSMEVYNGTTSTSTSTNINKWSYSIGLSGPSGSGTFRTLALLGENSSAFGTTDPTTLAVAPECNVMYEFNPAAAYSGTSTFAYTAPANDNVAGAITLNVNASPCTNLCGTYYTTGSATASPQASSCTAAPDDDVWFKFVAPESGQVTISVKGATGFDAVVSLHDDTYAAVTGFACVDGTTGAASNTNYGQTETLDPTGLTAGATYYIRVSHKGTGSGTRSGFSICVNNSVIPPPSNDNPCGAVALTLSTACTAYVDNSAVNSTTSVLSATNTSSNGVATPACTGASATVNDVWFKFTATGTSHVLNVTPVAGFDVAAQLYTAAGSCGGNNLVLTSVSCNNTGSTGAAEQISLTTVADTEYYVRVYRHPSGFTGAPVSNSQFSICVFTPVPACTTNTTPSNAATGTSLTPTLTWAAAQYASSYDVYLGTVSGPTTLLANSTTTSYTVTAGQALAGLTQYYWYVVPKNGNGAAICGAANQTSFTTQTACRVATALTVNNLNTTALTVDLSWTAPTAGPTPAGYEYAFTTSATAPASGTATTETTVTGQSITAGTSYYLHVRTSCGGGDYSAWATSAVFRYVLGDICSTAINLATLTSPHSGTTADATDNVLLSCDESDGFSRDKFYYIDVQPNYTLNIGLTATGYDSVVLVGYGNCTTVTTIACFDQPDTTTTNWMNLTGSTQRVYWVQDGYDSESGTFTLAWSLTPPPDCLPPSALVTNQTGSTVNISWTASESAPANGYQYEVRSANGVGTGATGLVTSGTVTGTSIPALTTLTIGTTYTVYVRALCSETISSTWNSKAFLMAVANDVCANAVTLTCGQSTTGTTVNATNENMAVCGFTSHTVQNSPGVWYKFTGDGSDVTISTCSPTQQDTRMAIYTGVCGTLACVAGNDDNAGCTTSTYSSEILLSTTDGTEYFVLIYQFGSTAVNFNISMSCVTPCTPATTNDNCSTAVALTVGTPLASNNTCSTATSGVAYPSCGSSFATYYDTWYTFNSGSNTSLEVSLTGASAATGFILYTGTCGGTFTPVTGSCVVNGAATTITVAANTNYHVRVYTNGAVGRGSFTLAVKPPCLRPTGVAASAVTVYTATISWTASTSAPANGYEYEVRFTGAAGSGATGLVASGSTATTSANLENLLEDTQHTIYVRSVCGEGNYGPWTTGVNFTTLTSCYKPTTPSATNVTATSATLSWNPPAESIPASGYAWEVRSSGAAGSGATGLVASGNVTSGTTVTTNALSASTAYTMYVRSRCGGGSFSGWTTGVAFSTTPVNDLCSGAIAITCGGEGLTGTTTGATNELMAVCGISGLTIQNTPGVWYKYVSNGTDVTFSTCATGTGDSRIAVFKGTCAALTCVGGNDDNSACTAANLSSEVTIADTQAGATYYILVYSYTGSPGVNPINFTLTATCAPACTPAAGNNEAANAQTLSLGATASNNTCATASLGYAYPSCVTGGQFATFYDVWYKFNTGTTTFVDLSLTATSPVAVGYAIYSGTSDNFTQVACSATGALTSVTGLSTNTVYYVRVSSTTKAARGNFTINLTVPCKAPTGLTVTNTQNSVSFYWTGSTSLPMNGYQYEVRTSGAAGSGATGLAFSGTSTALSKDITGLTTNTNYTVYVRSACGTSDFSPWTSGVAFFTGFCTPAPSSGIGDGITKVTYGTVSNITGAEAGNYANYTSMSGTVQRANDAVVKLKTAVAANAKIWVDWNNDLDFNDAGEEVYSGATVADSLSATFTVPTTTSVGTHRMRIGASSGTSLTPCYTGASAAFEDYTLNVDTMGPAHLNDAACNSTVTSFAQGLYINNIANVQSYRFRVRNGASEVILTRNAPYITLSMLPSPAFGVTYLIDVSVMLNGSWTDYGKVCKVNTVSPVQTTKLEICNGGVNQVAAFSTPIYATLVPAATNYRFLITSSQGTVTLDRPNRYFMINLIAGHDYNVNYTVRVATLSNGVWSDYGDSCVVRVGMPTVTLRSQYCNGTVAKKGTAIYANNYPGAVTYHFRVTVGGNQHIVIRNVGYFFLSQVPATINPGMTVGVEVKVFTAGAESDWGASCPVTLANPTGRPGTADVTGNEGEPVTKLSGFPNPFSESFALDFTTESEEMVNIVVYDMTGKLVDRRSVSVNELPTLKIGDNFAAGVYNLILTQGENVKTLRVVKSIN
ncbi:MAG: fibronectin type III domain-containing protein [Flavobacterium sp.]